MADQPEAPRWLGRARNRQLLAAVAAFGLLLLLAFCRKWPFHQQPVDLGANPSIWEILLNDRITMGLLRAGLASIVTYAVVSVPALIVGRRWMKGLTTAGVTADDAEKADQGIEDLQEELKATQEELQDRVAEIDLLSQWVLEMHSEEEENPSTEGGA